jgi:hypothetical protein
MYSDAQIDAAIADFLDGGPAIDIDLVDHFTPDQVRRYQLALEREEWRILCRWHREWAAGEIAEPPPTGAWSWSTRIPDTPAGLIDGDMT